MIHEKKTRRMLVTAAAMGAVLLISLCAGGAMDALSHAAGWKLGALFSLLATGALAVCAGLSEGSARRFALLSGITLAALLARLLMLDNVTSDYEAFLAKWVDTFRTGGLAMLTQEIGDYNLPYQYILALIARSEVYDLYLIKWVSVAFDFALALLMMRMTQQLIDTRLSTVVYAAVLFSPTVLLNGAYWAQCDALYVFFVVASLYLMLRDKPVRSVICMAVAFSFKLQTIFFFPMALFGLAQGKYKLRHALVFPATYLCTLLPALLLGRSLSSALMVYVNQSVGQYFERLTYNAGNIYQLFPTLFIGDDSGYRHLFLLAPEITAKTETYLNDATMMDLQNAALLFCAAAVLGVTGYLAAHRKQLRLEQVWAIALLGALFIPFVMPKMHDRYFFMAEMFAILYAARYPRRFWMPLCVTAASLICYAPFLMRQRPIPTQLAMVLNGAALVALAQDLLRALRAQAKRGEAVA